MLAVKRVTYVLAQFSRMLLDGARFAKSFEEKKTFIKVQLILGLINIIY